MNPSIHQTIKNNQKQSKTIKHVKDLGLDFVDFCVFLVSSVCFPKALSAPVSNM